MTEYEIIASIIFNYALCKINVRVYPYIDYQIKMEEKCNIRILPYTI